MYDEISCFTWDLNLGAVSYTLSFSVLPLEQGNKTWKLIMNFSCLWSRLSWWSTLSWWISWKYVMVIRVKQLWTSWLWTHWLTIAVSDWKEPKFATFFCNSEKSWKIWGMWKCEIFNRSMLFSLYKIIDLLHYLLPLLWKHTCLVFLHSNTVVAFVINPICGYFLYWFFPALPMQLTDI